METIGSMSDPRLGEHELSMSPKNQKNYGRVNPKRQSCHGLSNRTAAEGRWFSEIKSQESQYQSSQLHPVPENIINPMN
jgi:hypothetical protein